MEIAARANPALAPGAKCGTPLVAQALLPSKAVLLSKAKEPQ